ncbi:S8 family serine peptidase [Microbacteriaceae bacterium 4G12]
MKSNRRVMGAATAAMLVTALLTPAGVSVAQASAPGVRGASGMGRAEGGGALGNGLGRLLAQAEGAVERRSTSGLRLDQEALAIRDGEGRVLVEVTPREGADRAAFQAELEALGLVVQASDPGAGTLEGFLPLTAVRQVAALRDTGTIAQSLRPRATVGAATSQGVALERIDRVEQAGIDGEGITIGALSDSYDIATTTVTGEPLAIRAADDVASGDLPGPGNPLNPEPVVVLAEPTEEEEGSDEGRGMLQIAHDVAPAAKLCFATAFGGLLTFAQHVRDLADDSGPCAADVVVDDVIYFSEPFFSDSALSDAIDDVAAEGVHYFSSAGNQGNQQAWDAPVRLLPAEEAAAGSNLDLADIDPALYSGGLQDMDPGDGTDAAQTITLAGAGGLLNVQWDDPVDPDGPTLGEPLFSATGEITDQDPEPSFTFTATAEDVGRSVLFRTDAIPSGTTDLILAVTAPDGTVLAEIDTGSSPELYSTVLPEAGDYTITISGFQGAQGDFVVEVLPVVAPSRVSTDFNLLLFDMEGNFVGAVADVNTATGRPSEIVSLAGMPEFQLAISRAGTGPFGATRLRNVLFNGAYFTEYSESLAPSAFGHATARGATAVGAFDPFRPYLPEYFTSPGGDLQILFDSAGNRLPTPETRRVPQVTAADGGNTTFFGSDTLRDEDTQPNFFGTSAAAPHAASIAALALQQSGGPGSVSPDDLRRRLERSAFAHDLDPHHSEGTAEGLTITADGPQGNENSPIPGSMTDPNFFTATNTGTESLSSITFYGESGSPTALGGRFGFLTDGIVFDPRPFDGVAPFRNDGFPFTVGSTSGGLAADSVTASFSEPAAAPAVEGQYRRMTVSFANGLQPGQSVSFGVDRDLAVSGVGGAEEGNGADELGGATFLPSGIPVPFGMAFTAERPGGYPLWGAMANRLGSGWTPLDGYGLINAERAVLGH